MASLNRAQMVKHYYDLRLAFMVLSHSRGKDAKITAAKVKQIAMDIEGCIGQIDSQPAESW